MKSGVPAGTTLRDREPCTEDWVISSGAGDMVGGAWLAPPTLGLLFWVR